MYEKNVEIVVREGFEFCLAFDISKSDYLLKIQSVKKEMECSNLEGAIP